jgi:hypothetical protein
MTNLKTFNLYKNLLTNLPSYNKLLALYLLVLDNNQLTEIPNFPTGSFAPLGRSLVVTIFNNHISTEEKENFKEMHPYAVLSG